MIHNYVCSRLSLKIVSVGGADVLGLLQRAIGSCSMLICSFSIVLCEEVLK